MGVVLEVVHPIKFPQLCLLVSEHPRFPVKGGIKRGVVIWVTASQRRSSRLVQGMSGSVGNLSSWSPFAMNIYISTQTHTCV